MSLYDKYHSQQNKNYMYELISNIIKKEYESDPIQINSYNDAYEKNFKNAFQKINTDDIKDVNKELLDTQVNFFVSNLYDRDKIFKTESIDPEYEDSNLIVNSNNRIINLEHSCRYHYKIKLPDLKKNSFSVEKVVIPIDDSSLFIGPLLILNVNAVPVELQMIANVSMNNRTYGIYSPFYEKRIPLSDLNVTFRFINMVSTNEEKNDLFKILESDQSLNQIMIHRSNNYKIGDHIRVCDFEKKTSFTKILKIESVNHESDKTIIKYISDKEGEKLMLKDLYLLNLNEQNTIHINYE